MSMSFYSYLTVPCETEGTRAVFAPEEITPNFSNHNAHMILRALGCEDRLDDYGSHASIPVYELYGRVRYALQFAPVADDGQPNIVNGNFTMCGVRPGYFADAYEQIARVCEWTIKMGIPNVTVC